MSGHSKWSTIKRKKEATDAAKGKLFSKYARAISIAVKTGGGPNPDANYKLRVVIDQAKANNMPKANVDRALKSAEQSGNLEEITYEGFGPEGVNVMVETATDNRNRTVSEIKQLFERGGGRLGGAGSVSFNFEPKGLLVILKTKDPEIQMLKLIDLEVEDVEETEDAIEAYTNAPKVAEIREQLINNGFEVVTAELIQKPKSFQKIEDHDKAKRILSFLENLEDHDDVQKVFSNIDVPEDIISKI